MAKMKSAQEILREETGEIRVLGKYESILFSVIAIAWALFQLSIASFVILDSMTVRTIHLAFAMALVFLSIPMFKHPIKSLPMLSATDRVPVIDYILAIVGSISAMYLWIFWEEIALRPGAPITQDIVMGLLLVVLLLEATRRVIGPALPIIVLVFTLYAFFAEQMPTVLAFKSVSLTKYLNQISLSEEGIYGIPLGVSASIVYLFVLLGAMLDKAGAGRFFIDMALSLLGRYKGGPAKAAIVSSALTGLVSGSSIANIVTTGTFTIPLMKKVGYPAKKAAATEVAASTDGQLMPPIMGAAAFIIAEYVNVPYIEVVKAAAIPAFVSYFALFYITHLEASKLGMRGLTKEETPSFLLTLKNGLHYLVPIGLLVYELVVLRHSPELAAYNAILVLIMLVFVQEGRKKDYLELPAILRTFMRNSWVVPLVMVVWFAGILHVKFDIALFYSLLVQAVMVMIGEFIVLKKQSALGRTGIVDGVFIRSLRIVGNGFVSGSRNMVSVALATASAGIIVGIVNMGIGGMITQIVEVLAQGNIFLLLLITAIASLMLGMGLPTTATYIVMAALTAPIIVKVGGAYGYAIPLIAAHLFCFYFGILADDTPPVGLASYAAAAIADSDPIPTGLQGFWYDLRTAVIPFFFVFNTDLLLINVSNWFYGLFVFIMAVFGAFAFTAALQGWFLTKIRLYEVPLLFAATLFLFYPDAINHYTPASYWGPSTFYVVGLGMLVLGGIAYLMSHRFSKAELPFPIIAVIFILYPNVLKPLFMEGIDAKMAYYSMGFFIYTLSYIIQKARIRFGDTRVA